MKTLLHTDIGMWADVLESVMYCMCFFFLSFHIFVCTKVNILECLKNFFNLESGIFVAKTAISLLNAFPPSVIR